LRPLRNGQIQIRRFENLDCLNRLNWQLKRE
jgi:hypothetical protein